MGNQKGVTLIELVIIIVIISIGATLMVPGIGSWLPHYHLRKASREIASTMRLGQMKAISNNLTYWVAFDPANHSYILQYDSGGLIINEGDAQKLRDGIRLDTTFTGNVVRLRPDLTADVGRIRLTNAKGHQKTIHINGGRIRIE